MKQNLEFLANTTECAKPTPEVFKSECYLGFDFGTSGARAIVVDFEGTIRAEARYEFEPVADWLSWQKALFSLIEQIPGNLRQEIRGDRH